MLLYTALIHAVRHFGLSGGTVFRAVSVLSGGIYAAAGWYLCGRLCPSSPGRPSPGDVNARLLLFLGLMSAGTVELFCGYLEVYPLVLALLLTATATAVAAAEGRLPGFIPILLAAVCVALHRVSLFWIPAALLPLILAGKGRTVDGRLARRFTAVLLILELAGGLVLAGKLSVLLPLLPRPETRYTLFSVPHLSDYFNAQFLGSVAGCLLLPPALLRLWRVERLPLSSLVLCWSAAVPAVGLFLFRPILGGADWDLLVLAAPFAFLAAASAMNDFDEAAAGPPRARTAAHPAWIPVAVLFSVFNTVPWLLVQAGDASLARVRDLISTDAADYFLEHPAPLQLAFLFASNGLPDLQQEELKRGAQEFPADPRFAFNLAVLARDQGRPEDAERWALAAYSARRGYLPALDLLYDLYKSQNRRSDQEGAGRTILDAYSAEPALVRRYLPAERIAAIKNDLGLDH